ncbi:MAG: IPT/TIG domain-containing protein [Ferruginibacter sp.]
MITGPGSTVPAILSFSPTTGGTGTTVTITGTNFTGVNAVSFGGVPAASFTVVNATTITAVVGAGASGNVIVTNAAGTASAPGFTFTAGAPIQKGLVIHHANTTQCYGKAIAVDNQDNFIIAELFQGSITGKPFTSAGNIDALFAKHDKNGNILWERTAGGLGSLTTPHGVKTDAANNIYVTGYFGFAGSATSRTINFDTKSITSKSDYDVFLAKYNAGGTIQWALALGNTAGVTEERAWDIAVDAAGNSYICGAFKGSVDFNPLGTTPRILTAATVDNSIFLAKYDANGINLWATKTDANLGAVMTEAYAACGIDNSGNVFLAANYRNSITVGTNTYTSTGSTDIVLARYSQSTGITTRSKTFGGAGNDVVSPGALGVNAAGEPHFTGRFAGTSNMGGSTISSSAGAVTNLYVVACTNTGTTKWAVAIPGNSGQGGGHRIGFDNTGNVFIAGWYSGSGTLNGVTMAAKSGANAADIVMAKLNGTGSLQWLNSYGAVGYTGDLSIAAGLAIDSENNLLITGKFYGNDVDWDPSNTMDLKITSAGMDDGITAKYKSDGSLWQKP